MKRTVERAPTMALEEATPHLLEMSVVVAVAGTVFTYYFVRAFRDTSLGFLSRMICDRGPLTHGVLFLGYMNGVILSHVFDPKVVVARRWIKGLLISSALPLALGIGGALLAWISTAYQGGSISWQCVWDPVIVSSVVTLCTFLPTYRLAVLQR